MIDYVFNVLSYLFFFRQKTAYEMRISDWSSDVCSSDLGSACPRVRPKDQGVRLPAPSISWSRITIQYSQEFMMAKAQKRRNREIRKPKAVKTKSSVEPAGLLTMAVSTPGGSSRKKGRSKEGRVGTTGGRAVDSRKEP